MVSIIRLSLLALIVMVALPALAQTGPLVLRWPDLLPNLPPLHDPLGALTFDQRIELETVLWVRQLNDEERKARPEVIEEAKIYEQNLARSGLVVDTFVSEYEVFDQKLQKRGKLVRTDLSDKLVQIDGYLLPLEFSQDGVTDFLLVPYVGACIHVPPPPPNQIALLTLKEKLLVSDVFVPVRVTGVLRTKSSSAKLYLVDGEADISLGYRIQDGRIKLLK